MIRCKNHKELSVAIRDSVPAAPGVYLFKDDEGDALYIGKSVNLRNRMLSYFRQDFGAVETRIGQMIHGIRAFDFITVKTELQALLIEDELIKKELPPFNIRQKKCDENRFLLLTSDPYPTLTMVAEPPAEKMGITFGPYKDRYFVEELSEIIQYYFHIRSCAAPVPDKKCMNFDIGRCTGPCRNTISTDKYRIITEQVMNFLKGSHTQIMHEIENEMKAAASKKLYEKAAVMKSHREFCERFCSRQRFIHKFRTGRLVIPEEGDKGIRHIFDRGRWIAGRGAMAGAAEVQKSQSDARFVVDRANIIYNWLKKKGLSNE